MKWNAKKNMTEQIACEQKSLTDEFNSPWTSYFGPLPFKCLFLPTDTLHNAFWALIFFFSHSFLLFLIQSEKSRNKIILLRSWIVQFQNEFHIEKCSMENERKKSWLFKRCENGNFATKQRKHSKNNKRKVILLSLSRALLESHCLRFVCVFFSCLFQDWF